MTIIWTIIILSAVIGMLLSNIAYALDNWLKDRLAKKEKPCPSLPPDEQEWRRLLEKEQKY